MAATREPGDGAILFSDDFASGELDRTRWNVRVTGDVVNDELQAYVDTDETVYVSGDGHLMLHARSRPGHTTADGRTFDFVSGRIDTRDRFAFRYGTAEARMKLPAGAGLWPAFWMMGAGPWPDTGEIDVMECVGDPDWVSSGVHGPGYSGESGLVNRLHFEHGHAAEWHVYAIDWAPDRITFLVDGRVTYRVTRPMTEFFGSWAFDDQKFLILNLAIGGVYPFKTNGVRTPYYGLAHAAVAAIEGNRAVVAVDWVRVTAGGS